MNAILGYKLESAFDNHGRFKNEKGGLDASQLPDLQRVDVLYYNTAYFEDTFPNPDFYIQE